VTVLKNTPERLVCAPPSQAVRCLALAIELDDSDERFLVCIRGRLWEEGKRGKGET
jgi:hypothetical protein